MLRDYAYESASNRVQHILVSHVVGEPTGVLGARIHNHEFEIKASAPVSRRSMRGERPGFVLDRRFLGHDSCGGRRLLPPAAAILEPGPACPPSSPASPPRS